MTGPARDPYPIEVHSPWMRRLARGLVGDGLADDVVQEAWTRHPGAGPAYLRAIVRSLAGHELRARERRARRERIAARPEALPSSAEVAARIEITRRVAEALESLDEPYRTTLVLRYYDDLSSAEIARRSKLPASTVRARVARGLELLRLRLDDHEGDRRIWMQALLPLAGGERLPSLPPSAAALSFLAVMKVALSALVLSAAVLVAWNLARGPRPDASLPRIELAAREDSSASNGPAAAGRTLPAQREVLAPPVLGTEEVAGRSANATLAVEGRAVLRSGQPLATAWMSLRGDDEPVGATREGWLSLPLTRERLARTMVRTRTKSTLAIEVGAPRHCTRVVEVLVVDEGASVLEAGDVFLEPGGAVEGLVADADGFGVEGAQVVFGRPLLGDVDRGYVSMRGPSDLSPDPWSGEPPARATRSGPGGRFRIDGVPVGYGTLWARTDTSLWSFGEPIGVRAGEEIAGLEIAIQDRPEAVITGRVVDPEGHPVPGVRLSFYESGNPDAGWNEEETGHDGRFFFVPHAGKAQDIAASPPDWDWDPVRILGVAAGTHDLEIAFQRSRWFLVEARGLDGALLENGLVVGVPAEGATAHGLPRSEAKLGADGRARLRRTDEPLRVRVSSPGYRDALLGPIEPAEFPEPLVVTLEPVPALVGQVLRADGTPAAGATVSLHAGAGSGGGVRPPGETRTELAHLTHQGWSGDRDPFVYEVRVDPISEVLADGEGRFRLPLPGVDAEAEGEEADTSAMADFGGGGSLSKRLKGSNPEKPWYVHARLAGEATVTDGPHFFATTEDQVVNLELPPGGTLVGRLVIGQDLSPAGWTALASDARAEVAQVPVARDGTFRFESLHAGGWQVRVLEPGKSYYPGSMRTDRVPVPDVQITAGAVTEYEHRTALRKGAVLEGRLWIDGAPPGPWIATVRTSTPQSAITSYEATLDPDGRFEVLLEPDLRTFIWLRGVIGKSELSLSTEIEVPESGREWSYDFTTARLDGVVPMPDVRFGYASERDGVEIQVPIKSDLEGRFGPLIVPSGRGILRGPPPSWREGGPVWAELDLARGESRAVEVAK